MCIKILQKHLINQQQITLNKGEVYLVQADNKRNLSDMTGSQVIADKEIAVFAGHQRASIPKEYNRNPSRDCLIEQMLPVNTWGKKCNYHSIYQNKKTCPAILQ